MRIIIALWTLLVLGGGRGGAQEPINSEQIAPEREALVVQNGPRGEVRAAQISPDGSRLATLDGRRVQLWRRDGGLLWSRGVSGDPQALAWRSDSGRLAVGVGGTEGFFVSKPGDSAGALELDVRDGRILRTLLHDNNTVSRLAYLRDGRLLVQSHGDSVAWDGAGQKSALKMYGALFPSPNGETVALLTSGVQLWDAALTRKSTSLWQKGMPTRTLAWSPDGARLAVGDMKRVQIWNIASRAVEREIALPAQVLPANASATEFDALSLVWTPDGGALWVARTDFPEARPDEQSGRSAPGRPRLWLGQIESASGQLETLRAGERRAITTLAMWPDATLIWGGADGDEPPMWSGELHFMRANANAVGANAVGAHAVQAIWSAPQPLQAPTVLELSPDGATLAVGGEDTAVRLWSLRDGRLTKSLKEFSAEILALRWSPSGRYIAALDYENLFVFDVVGGRGRTFKGTPIYDVGAPSLSWSPDEQQIAFEGGAGTFVFDRQTQKTRELTMPGRGDFNTLGGPLRWTREGLEAAGGLMLIEPRSGRVLRELNATGVASERGHEGPVRAFAWLENGRRLLTLGGDEARQITVKRWDVAANRVERTLEFASEARALALSPDAKYFAVGGASGQVVLCDTQSLETRWNHQFEAPIHALMWSGSGDALFAATDDGWTHVLSAEGARRGRFAALPSPELNATGYEWMHVAPDNHFLASPKAAAQLRWRNGLDLLPLNAVGTPLEKLPLSAAIVALRSPAGLTARAMATPTPLPTPKAKSVDSSGAPVLVLQGLAAGQFRALAVSRATRWIVTHDEGGAQTLWDGRAGLQWGELKNGRDRVPLFFSPDGTLLFCAPTAYPGDGEVYRALEVRRVPGGELVRRFALQAPYWGDGKTVRGVVKGAVETWSIAAGKRLARRPIAGLAPGNRLAFSPDGGLLVAGGEYYKDRTARVWRVSDGQKIIEIKDPQRIIGPTAVSSDGRFVATEGEDPNWSPPTDGPMTESAYARTFRIHLWNARTRRLLHTYAGYYSLSGGVQLLRFAPDNRALLSAGKDGNLRRLDIASRRVTEVVPAPKDALSPLDWPIALAPDARSGAGRTREFGLATFEVAANRLKTRFAGPVGAPDQAFWSPDGRYVFAGGLLFDAHGGALLANAPNAYVREAVWRDGEVWTTSLQSVTRWKVPSLKKLDEWRIAPLGQSAQPKPAPDIIRDYSDGVRLSPDGATVLTSDPKGTFGGGKPGLWVWDAATRRVRRTLIPDFGHGYSSLDQLVFFPRGDKIVRPTKSGLELWDLNSGEKLQSWRDPIDPNYQTQSYNVALLPLAVSPDEKLIAVRATRNDAIWIFHADGAAPLQLLVKAGYRAHFLRDARRLLLQNGAKWQLWDARGEGRQPLRTLGADDGHLQPSPDEKLAAIGSQAKAGLQVWNLARDEEALRWYVVGANRDTPPAGWIALTPQGFYAASPEGEKRLRWRDAQGFWPLEKSRARFHRPDSVAAALQP